MAQPPKMPTFPQGSKTRVVIEKLFRIYNKEGELVDFILNNIQREVDRTIIAPIEYCEEHGYDVPPELLATLRTSILKYRQGGISTLILAWFLVRCMTKYTVAVMLTHDMEHSQRLLERAKDMLKNLKGPSPKTSKLNANEIKFGKTNSTLYVGTAGSKEFGRSATITHLHCSEIAFWADPGRLMKSLFQAVPKRTGVIVQETTANGWGNWFQKAYYKYRGGTGGFVPHFYPWYIHEEYVSETPLIVNAVSFEERREERRLYRLIRRVCPHYTPDEVRSRLQWRREKIDEMQGDLTRERAISDFKQEYPSTYEEAFTETGGTLFPSVMQIESPDWVTLGPNEQGLRNHPIDGHEYAVGIDFAGGTGNDLGAIVVLCLNTKEQVYRFADNRINPIALAEKVVSIGKRYNMAYLVPEINSHGIAGTEIIKRHYPYGRIYKRARKPNQTNVTIPAHGYGWQTSGTTKPYMVGVAQQFILAGWKIYDPLTYDQLRSFKENPDTGKLEADTGHDDVAMSFMLACLGILRLLRMTAIDVKEITADELSVTAAERLAQLRGVTLERSKVKPRHRDEQGRFLVHFNDMFGHKRRARHHVA